MILINSNQKEIILTQFAQPPPKPQAVPSAIFLRIRVPEFMIKIAKYSAQTTFVEPQAFTAVTLPRASPSFENANPEERQEEAHLESPAPSRNCIYGCIPVNMKKRKICLGSCLLFIILCVVALAVFFPGLLNLN